MVATYHVRGWPAGLAQFTRLVPEGLRRALLGAEALGYRVTLFVLMPVNHLLARLFATRFVRGSVLHVSAMVHVPYYTVKILRAHGVDADYLAVGDSPWWSQSDYHYRATRWPVLSVLKEMWWVWRVVSRYEIVHAHFMVTVSRSGWECRLLRQMGRHIVVHYRGCEIRNRERNQALHPVVNICQECDYSPRICEMPINVVRRDIAAAHGSAFLVTTPDMKDFAPQALHVPFFITRSDLQAHPMGNRSNQPFKIVHATNHRGIEGSRHIRTAIDNLIAKGFPIYYVDLTGVTHERVLAELADADLSIGKMKMGYYANMQVEAMAAGVPTVTCVRPEFMTDALRQSGFIFATLETLESTLEFYLANPEALAQKRAVARQSILGLHDNAAIAREYGALYAKLQARNG